MIWSPQNTDLCVALSRFVLGSEPRDARQHGTGYVLVGPAGTAADTLLPFLSSHGLPHVQARHHVLAPKEPLVVDFLQHKWEHAFWDGAVVLRNLPASADAKDVEALLSARCRADFEVAMMEDQQSAVVALRSKADADALLAPVGAGAFGAALQAAEPFAAADDAGSGLKVALQGPDEAVVVYDSIVIEDFPEFAGYITLDKIHTVVAKLSLFHAVDSVLFPIDNVADAKTPTAAFVRFAPGANLSFNVLNCLYFLGGLSFERLSAFEPSDIQDIQTSAVAVEKAAGVPGLNATICQKKHSQHVHNLLAHRHVTNAGGDASCLYVTEKSEGVASKFLKDVNYQETNVYVNQLPLLFKNNDNLWCDFWVQIGRGSVKSAKIIKPQFYSKKSDFSHGKFGFVFYEEFKSALRAILLTNGRVISIGKEPKISVSASFALQKRVSNPPANRPAYGAHTAAPENFDPAHFPRHSVANLVNSQSYMAMPGENFFMDPYYGSLPLSRFPNNSDIFMAQNVYFGYSPCMIGPMPSHFGYYMMPYPDVPVSPEPVEDRNGST